MSDLNQEMDKREKKRLLLLELLDDPDVQKKLFSICGSKKISDDEGDAKLRDRLCSLEAKNEQLEKELKEANDQLQNLQESSQKLDNRLQSAEQQNRELKEKLKSEKEKNEQLEKQKDSSEGKINRLNKELADTKNDMAKVQENSRRLAKSFEPYSRLEKIFCDYAQLSDAVRSSLCVSICTASPISFACSAADNYRTLYGRLPFDCPDPVLLELYRLGVDILCEKNSDIEIICPDPGDCFDTDLHNDGGGDGRYIDQCIVCGVRNKRTGKVEVKAKVRTR